MTNHAPATSDRTKSPGDPSVVWESQTGMQVIEPHPPYTEKVLRIIANLYPECARFKDGRLELTGRGRAFVTLHRARKEPPASLAAIEATRPGQARAALHLAFEAIRERREREMAEREQLCRKVGLDAGRRFVLEASPAAVSRMIEIVAGFGTGADVVDWITRENDDLHTFLRVRLRESGIAENLLGDHSHLDHSGFSDGFCMQDPELIPFFRGFFIGITQTWREYLEFESERMKGTTR